MKFGENICDTHRPLNLLTVSVLLVPFRALLMKLSGEYYGVDSFVQELYVPVLMTGALEPISLIY